MFRCRQKAIYKRFPSASSLNTVSILGEQSPEMVRNYPRIYGRQSKTVSSNRVRPFFFLDWFVYRVPSALHKRHVISSCEKKNMLPNVRYHLSPLTRVFDLRCLSSSLNIHYVIPHRHFRLQ